MVPTLKDNVFKALMWQTAHFQQSICMRHVPSDEVVRFLDIYAILCQGWCQIFHCQRVFLVLASEMNSTFLHHIFILYKLWPADSNIHYIIDNYYSIDNLRAQTLALFRELPEAVPFILQCCSASFAISEMNFCDARDMRRILTTYKRILMQGRFLRSLWRHEKHVYFFKTLIRKC